MLVVSKCPSDMVLVLSSEKFNVSLSFPVPVSSLKTSKTREIGASSELVDSTTTKEPATRINKSLIPDYVLY